MANTTKDDKKDVPHIAAIVMKKNCWISSVGAIAIFQICLAIHSTNQIGKKMKECINKKVIARKKYHYQETFQYEYDNG